MPRKRYSPEQIVAKLRRADVELSDTDWSRARRPAAPLFEPDPDWSDTDWSRD